MLKLTWTGMLLGILLTAGCGEADSQSGNSASGGSGPDLYPVSSTGRPLRPRSVSLTVGEAGKQRQRISMPTAESISSQSEAPTPLDQENQVPESLGFDHGDASDAPVQLHIGDVAPVLSINKWVHGAPVDAFGDGKVYVVEFWETTFEPCMDSIRHSAILQAEYGEKVVFIGISTEDENIVTAFLEKTSGADKPAWSEVINYSIGLDDLGQTRSAFMDAAEQDGIPCSFIVGRSGLIEWFGHSMEIDAPLKGVVEGNWESSQARELVAEHRSARKAKLEKGSDIRAAIDSGEYALAVQMLDELLQRFPGESDLSMFRLQCLIQGGLVAEANATASQLIAAAQEDPLQLNRLAWMIATAPDSPGLDLDQALSAAQRAEELTDGRNGSVLETMARLQFQKGNVSEAIALQKRTLELNSNSAESAKLQATLEEFEKAGQAENELPQDSAPKSDGPQDSASDAQRSASPSEPSDESAVRPD